MTVDVDLLMELFWIPAPNYDNKKFADFVLHYIQAMGIEPTVDEDGNLFVFTNLGKPLLSAHLDTVQHSDDVKKVDSIKMIGQTRIQGTGVLGGDDKCGVYIILDLLSRRPGDFNFLLSRREESNGTVKTALKAGDITHCPWGLVLDRKGSGDIICSQNNYGTKEFEDALVKVGTPFGFKPVRGAFSDADSINEYISCANLSMGYYEPHSVREYVIIADLDRAMAFVDACLDQLSGTTFKKPEKKIYSYYGAGGGKWSGAWAQDSWGVHESWGYGRGGYYTTKPVTTSYNPPNVKVVSKKYGVCYACMSWIPIGEDRCPYCRTDFFDLCPECGSPVDDTDMFCYSCEDVVSYLKPNIAEEDMKEFMLPNLPDEPEEPVKCPGCGAGVYFGEPKCPFCQLDFAWECAECGAPTLLKAPTCRTCGASSKVRPFGSMLYDLEEAERVAMAPARPKAEIGAPVPIDEVRLEEWSICPKCYDLIPNEVTFCPTCGVLLPTADKRVRLTKKTDLSKKKRKKAVRKKEKQVEKNARNRGSDLYHEGWD